MNLSPDPTDSELVSARIESLPGTILAVPPDLPAVMIAWDRQDDRGNVRTFRRPLTPQLQQRRNALQAPNAKT